MFSFLPDNIFVYICIIVLGISSVFLLKKNSKLEEKIKYSNNTITVMKHIQEQTNKVLESMENERKKNEIIRQELIFQIRKTGIINDKFFDKWLFKYEQPSQHQ